VRRGDPQALVESVFHNPHGQLDPGMVDYYRRQFANRRWRVGLLRTIRGTMGHCIRDRLGEVTQPTLLVSGAEDRIVDPEHARAAARLLPRGHYLSVPQCGHAPQIERAWLVNRLVVHYLTSPRPSPHTRLTQLVLARPTSAA
jgi:pimeloyl-ACP methyl ester carboxylesterase